MSLHLELTCGRTVASWITQNHRASKLLVERLTPVIDARTGPRELYDLPRPKPVGASILLISPIGLLY